MSNTKVIAFHDQGFLSAEVTGWTLRTYAAKKPLFDLMHEMNAEAMNRLYAATPNHGNSAQLVGAILFGRLVQSFQACAILGSRGMASDSRTLVRSATESAIALRAIACDPTFVDDLVADHERHTMNAANAFLNDPEIKKSLDAEGEANLRKVVADIGAKYVGKTKDGKPPSINWAAVAQRKEIGMSSVYNTVYREMSGDGAHATINALNRHAKADENYDIQSLLFEPSAEGLDSAFCAACIAMIFAMEALEVLFGAKTPSDTVKAFAERIKQFEELLYADLDVVEETPA